ncbi:hypothetical protein ACA875_000974 [Vibrio parahaemolyticus]|jgi:hypothetical protein
MTELIKWPKNNFTKDNTKTVILKSIEADIEKTVKKAAKFDNFSEQAKSHMLKLHRLFKMKEYCNNINNPQYIGNKKLLVSYLKRKKVCPHRTRAVLSAYVEGW